MKVYHMPGDSLIQTISLNYTYEDYRLTPDGKYLLLRRYVPASIAIISTDTFDEVGQIDVAGDMYIAEDENVLLVDSYQKAYKIDLSSFNITDSATTRFWLGEADIQNHITYGAGNLFGQNSNYTYVFDYQNMNVIDSFMMVTSTGYIVSPNRIFPIPSKNRLYIEAISGLIFDTQSREFVGSFPCNSQSSIVIHPDNKTVYVGEPVEYNGQYIPSFKTTVIDVGTDNVSGYFSTVTPGGVNLAIQKMLITPSGDHLIGLHPTSNIKINTETGEVTTFN